MDSFLGQTISVSAAANRLERRFPDKPRTKRRMRRVRGKYGSWMVVRPAIFHTGNGWIMHPAKYSELRGQIENLSGELLRGAMFGEGRFGDGNGGLLLPVLKALSPPLSGFRDGGPVKVGGALYGHTYLSGEAILRPQSLFTGKDIA